jgi:hypothetical protein
MQLQFNLRLMELLYIYIEEYKSLKNQDINFGGEYRFSFDKEKRKLEISKNDLYISDFYKIGENRADVLNVSSIIGENGTGKSSILQFIKDNLCRGKNLEYPAVIAVKSEGQFKVFSTYEDIEVDQPKFALEIIENPTKEEDIFNFGYDFRGFPLTDIVFFSNIFDGTPGGTVGGMYDVSTNGLIYEDYNRNVQQRIISSDEDHIAVFLTDDVYRQLVLITSDIPRELFPFRLPKTLMVAVYEILNSFNKDSSEYTEFERLKKAIKEHYIADYLRIDGSTIVEDNRQIHINYLIAAALECIVRELLQVQSQGKSLGFEFRFSSEFIIDNDRLVQYVPFEQRISYFFDQVESQIYNSATNIEQLKELINNNRSFVDFILKNKDMFYNHHIDHRNPASYINIYDGNQSNEVILKDFMH